MAETLTKDFIPPKTKLGIHGDPSMFVTRPKWLPSGEPPVSPSGIPPPPLYPTTNEQQINQTMAPRSANGLQLPTAYRQMCRSSLYPSDHSSSHCQRPLAPYSALPVTHHQAPITSPITSPKTTVSIKGRSTGNESSCVRVPPKIGTRSRSAKLLLPCKQQTSPKSPTNRKDQNGTLEPLKRALADKSFHKRVEKDSQAGSEEAPLTTMREPRRQPSKEDTRKHLMELFTFVTRRNASVRAYCLEAGCLEFRSHLSKAFHESGLKRLVDEGVVVSPDDERVQERLDAFLKRRSIDENQPRGERRESRYGRLSDEALRRHLLDYYKGELPLEQYCKERRISGKCLERALGDSGLGALRQARVVPTDERVLESLDTFLAARSPTPTLEKCTSDATAETRIISNLRADDAATDSPGEQSAGDTGERNDTELHGLLCGDQELTRILCELYESNQPVRKYVADKNMSHMRAGIRRCWELSGLKKLRQRNTPLEDERVRTALQNVPETLRRAKAEFMLRETKGTSFLTVMKLGETEEQNQYRIQRTPNDDESWWVLDGSKTLFQVSTEELLDASKWKLLKRPKRKLSRNQCGEDNHDPHETESGSETPPLKRKRLSESLVNDEMVGVAVQRAKRERLGTIKDRFEEMKSKIQRAPEYSFDNFKADVLKYIEQDYRTSVRVIHGGSPHECNVVLEGFSGKILEARHGPSIPSWQQAIMAPVVQQGAAT